MANPLTVSLTADTWVKVATAVYSGLIYAQSTPGSSYLYTYRVTGDPAPTDLTGPYRAQIPSEPVQIISDEQIDVYFRSPIVTGSVTVQV